MSLLFIANAHLHRIMEGGRTYLNSLVLRLYKNPVALSGTVMPDHATDEATDGGYAPIVNPFPNAFAQDGADAVAVGVTPTFVFDHDEGDWDVEGIYFTDPANGNAVVMAQAADPVFTNVAPGQVYVVGAKFKFRRRAS